MWLSDKRVWRPWLKVFRCC